jgi:uncharacterized Tic20 family protein
MTRGFRDNIRTNPERNDQQMTQDNPNPSPVDPVPPTGASVPPTAAEPVNYASPAGAAAVYAGPVPDANGRTMGMLCHLLALAGFLVPFGNVIGPLVIWLMKKDESPFVNDQGKESLNFQITLTLATIVLGILAGITVCIGIGLLLLPLVGLAFVVVELVFVILASMAANKGEAYRYPFNIRLIK